MRFKRWLIIIALVGVTALSAAGYTDRALNWIGTGYLTRANNTYLDDAFDKSLTGFLLLSSIKSGLAVVEGSQVGIGFNLELGDIVQPVYDYVDIAWKAALTGGSIIIGMQLALKSLALVDHWLLAGSLLLLTVKLLSRWLWPRQSRLHQGIGEALRFATTLTVACYLLLPLSVTGAAALSHTITGPMIEASHQELRRIEEEISPGKADQAALADLAQESFSAPSLKKKLSEASTGIQMLISFLKTETDRIAALTLKLIAAYVFDCILFPLLFGLILITMIKGGVHYFFDLSRLKGT
ncbi:MAG: hypothetical protein P8X96_22265 [Desulfobacteraceae bacterium]